MRYEELAANYSYDGLCVVDKDGDIVRWLYTKDLGRDLK